MNALKLVVMNYNHKGKPSPFCIWYPVLDSSLAVPLYVLKSFMHDQHHFFFLSNATDLHHLYCSTIERLTLHPFLRRILAYEGLVYNYCKGSQPVSPIMARRGINCFSTGQKISHCMLLNVLGVYHSRLRSHNL